MSDLPRRRYLGASPLVIALIAVVAVVGAVLLGLSQYRVKPATNSARAMALAADEAKVRGTADAAPAQAQ